MHHDLISRQMAVDRQLGSGLPRVMADRVQIEQVLINLLLNACDACVGNAASDRRLKVKSRCAGACVLLSVYDQGCGLSEDPERLFQPFYTTKSQGLGMGLAICRSIVQAHSGRVWAEKNTPRGSVFHVSLPAIQETA